MISHPLPSESTMGAGENVEAGFEPVPKALRDLYSFMKGMVGGLSAIACEAPTGSCLRAGHCVVAVQLDHCCTGSNRIGAVDLDFVVALCAYASSCQQTIDKEQ